MTCDLTKDAIGPTVGAVSAELSVKDQGTHNAIEQMRENLTDYDRNIHECVSRGKKDIRGDFYIVVITKKERLMSNVLRNYFGFRRSCPTPDYDQAVYRYTCNDDKIEFLWVIPARDVCGMILAEKELVPPEEWELLNYILKFQSGELMKHAQKLNGEI